MVEQAQRTEWPTVAFISTVLHPRTRISRSLNIDLHLISIPSRKIVQSPNNLYGG